MKRLAILAFAMSVMAALLTGCHTSKKVTTTDTPGSPNSEVVAVDSYGYLSRRLGISIGKHDKENLELFTVAEKWLGVPYRYGGNTKKGCDCSGFVSQVYKAVYGKSLERNSAAIRDKNCSQIRRSQLRTGDLVFSRRVRREKSTMWASTLKMINLSMPLQARGLLSAVWKRSIILEHMCVPDVWINPLGMEFCFFAHNQSVCPAALCKSLLE